MNEKVIELAKSLSVGPCMCRWDMGWGSCGTYDPLTGKAIPGRSEHGPRTHHCMRCRAREALEADGIEYTKDDSCRYDVVLCSQTHG